MAKLNILRYPDPRLHTIARPVQAVDGRIRKLVDDMAETMYAAPGIGLAATQVDVHEPEYWRAIGAFLAEQTR